MSYHNEAYKGKVNAFIMLLRRELWESRILQILPIVIVLISILGALTGLAIPGRLNNYIDVDDVININGSEFSKLPGLQNIAEDLSISIGEVSVGNIFRALEIVPPEVTGKFVELGLVGASTSIGIIFAFIMIFYLSRCLFNENKDKSVYFWKSMPVSETQTILAKFTFGLPIIILIMWLTMIVSQVMVLSVFSIAATFSGVSAWDMIWGPARMWYSWGLVLKELSVQALWFLPAAGLLLAFHSWAPKRRTLVVIISFSIIFGEKIVFGTRYIAGWCMRHFIPPGFNINGSELITEGMGHGMDIAEVSLLSFDFISGIILGIALIYAATWLRRYREEL
jgi:ABC-2 type transport system permease protein